MLGVRVRLQRPEFKLTVLRWRKLMVPRKKSLLLLFFLLIAFAVETKAFAEDNSILRIGAILPLTGGAADYGVSIKNGISLAQEDRPDLFTRIKFIYEDAQYSDAKQSITAFRKLTNIDHSNLIYEFGVPPFKALAPLAESQQIVLIGQCVDTSTGAGRRYVLRFMNTPDDYMQVLVRFLQKKGWNKIGMVVSDQPYLEEMYNAFNRSLLPGQSGTIIQRLPPDEMDLRSYVLRAKSENFDVIGVFLNIGQISQFYKQADSLKLTKPTFGTNFFESLSEIRASNGTMSGAVYAHNDIKSEFLTRYKSLFGAESQIAFGALSYEFAIAVGKLFNAMSITPTSDEIIHGFESLKLQDGIASGPYDFVSSEHFGKYFRFPIVMKQVNEDGFTVIK